jgi:hypothetical protein
MATYTVHEPPARAGQAASDPDRFVFVRDGFYFWAFLFGPLWMLWRRLWLVLLLYVVAIAVTHVGIWALGASGSTRLIVNFLIALLVGFEAGTLWRWTLSRRGWNSIGVVVAPNLEAAERRFFDAYLTHRPPPPPAAATPALQPARMPPPAPEVIGLFPQPEPRR